MDRSPKDSRDTQTKDTANISRIPAPLCRRQLGKMAGFGRGIPLSLNADVGATGTQPRNHLPTQAVLTADIPAGYHTTKDSTELRNGPVDPNVYEDSEAEHSILVHGILGLDKEILLLFFENEKKCGGGEIKSIEIFEADGFAVIEYDSQSVAQRVLARGPIFTIRNTILKVEKLKKPDPRSILIEGISPDTTDEILMLYFENKKRSGGGSIVHMQYDKGSSQAIITFEDIKVTERVLQNKGLNLCAASLTVSPVSWRHLNGSNQRTFGEITSDMKHEGISGESIESLQVDQENIVGQISEASRFIKNQKITENPEVSIQRKQTEEAVAEVVPSSSFQMSPNSHHVTGIHTLQMLDTSGLSAEYIKLILEKDIQGSIEIDFKADAATVRFQHQQDASYLLQRGSIMIEGRRCKLVPLYTAIHDRTEGSFAIRVEGLNENITKDMLEMLFANRRKSGGYDLRSIYMPSTGGEAIITFHCRDAVKSVLGMQSKRQLKMKNAQLDIKEMKPLPPPPFIIGPTESKKIIMTEAPSVEKEDLELFLSGDSSNSSTNESDFIPRVHIAQVQYAYKKNVILIEFKAIPDYDAMLHICVTFPLKDRMTSLQKVAIPTGIIVNGVNNLDKEDLELYFEDPKSGGGEIIEEISFHYDNQCAVINFDNYQVVESILKQKHNVRGQAVEVDAFYPAFGTWPSDYNRWKPWHSLPQPFIFKIPGQEIELDRTKNSELHISYLHDGAENIPTQKEWEERAREVINQLMDSICVKKIALSEECFERIQEEVKKMMTKYGSIHLDIHKDQSIIVFTGWREEITRFLETLQPTLQHIEEEFMRETQSITEQVPLKHHERIIIKTGNHTKTLRQKCPGVEVKINKNCLTLIGLPQEVNKAKLYVYENITQMIKCRQYQFSKKVITFVQRKRVHSFVISELKKASVVVVPEFADSYINAYAMSDQDLKVYEDIMKKSIVERRVALNNESKLVLQHSAWQSFKTDLVAGYSENILIEEDGAANGICLVTLSHLADVILETINDILEEYSVCQTEYPVNPPICRLISEFYNDEVKAIESSLNSFQCNITQSANGFMIKGNKSAIGAAKQALQNLCSKVCWKDHLIDNEEVTHYLESSEAANHIKLLEIASKVVCIHLNSQTLTNKGVVTKVDPNGRELYSTTIEQATIRILIGDITKQNVDAIVNAANGRLKMSGGLAAAILKAGGDEIQAECDRYMAGRKELLPGEVHVSKPGRLPCKIIIHAVGPTWKDGKSGEENELFEAVAESLDRADRAGMQSIALPAISTGVFGFPLQSATKIICEAVIEHFKQNPTSGLKSIHLIDNRPECGESLVKSLKAYGQQSGSDKAKTSTSWQLIKDRMKKWLSSSDQGQTTDKIQTPEGITIWIKQGSLTNEQVDVIVNTTSTDFNLSSGGVSSVIINAAGNIIQQECDMNKPAHVSAGDIVRTSGGKLPVRKIFHGFCEQWDGGKHLRRFVSEALKEAHNDGCQSIAFPAIGTGNLNYDPNDVASLMIKEIKHFSASVPATNLKDVRIILHPSNTKVIKAFEAYQKNVMQESIKIRKLYKEEGNGASVNTSYDIIQNTKVMLSFQLSSVIVVLKMGDITKENSDVIMNSTDGNFSQTGVIAQAITKVGGNAVEQECAQWLEQYGSLPEIAITNAGNLPCKKIVHVNVTSGEDWFFLFLKVLIAAEHLKMMSVAIPAIGSGGLNKRPENVCQKIMQALVNFAFEVKPKYVKSVSVVVFDKLIFGKYKNYMEQELKSKQSGMLPGKTEVPLPSSLTYRIYGMDQKNVSLFIESLNDFCNISIQTHEFKDEEEQQAISLMGPHDIQKVKALENQFKVSITVTQGVRLNCIVVKGTTKNLTACISMITKILHQVQTKHEEQTISDLISKQVKWQFLIDNIYRDYPSEINYVIEKAFSKHEKIAQWKEEDGEFKVYFDKMKERRNDDPTTDTDVRRQTEGSLAGPTVQLPSDWVAMTANEIYKKVTLTSTSSEYQDVAQKFALGGIKSISRIQNPNLYHLYEVNKKQMESTNTGIQNERLLFHGTAEHNVENINSYGFNRSYCGKHGTALGVGVYFAANASYSAQSTYATPNSSGMKHVYLAKVLVGRTTVGQGNMKEPPYLNGNSGRRFDSVSDQAQSMFVIFKDSQAYPSYLITF